MFPICNQSRTQRWFTRSLRFALPLIGVGILAAVGCSKSESHVPVHPVVGEIKFQGQPAAGAFVSLHPQNAAEGVPNPRATVAKDGSFTVSTFEGNDGAPEGDYVVTVQWYKPVRQGPDLVGGPNVLPPKYSSATSSDIKIHIAAGENRLKPIQLR
jgi:hypothetical protein